MQEWARPYLFEENEKSTKEDEISSDLREYALDRFREELESDQAVYLRIADELRIHFGWPPIGGIGFAFKETFGSVLSDLPKEAFLKIVAMRNVFYTFTPNPGAEVIPFGFEDGENVSDWDRIIVVTFPYEISIMPPMVQRGSIVHELAHVYLHAQTQAVSNEAMEKEADQLAEVWGFKEEIAEMRKYGQKHGL